MHLMCSVAPINKLCVWVGVCLPQVSIQADLEKKIIKLINDFRQENGDKGPVSGRLTSKKLLVRLNTITTFVFSREKAYPNFF